ncbi:beta-propeller domain-containing protein [Anaerobacillus sp. HL2]|nr:beta-propeller domain-containing protein [Anaerobacillus sp. HL2]
MSTSSNSETLIYKFKLNDGVATFLHEGKVEGSLLNQFFNG